MTDKDDIDGLARRMKKRAMEIGDRYYFKSGPPGVMVRLTASLPVEAVLPEGLCWEEYNHPPASEVANTYLYDKQYYIYGCNGPRDQDGVYEPGPPPVLMARHMEYFVVWLYKDSAK